MKFRRIARAVVLLVIALVVLPYLLTPVYLVMRPVSTPMIWRYVTFQSVVRIYRPMEDISPVLRRTVIASEDARFCAHHGIDWQGLRTLLEEAEDFDDLRGGSTITQQTAKNLFLWSDRSYLRKVLEIPLSLWMDLILPKRRILEIYLNIAQWGPHGEFGAEAGSRRAFNKPASDLGSHEAALLAAMLPNPVARDARQPGPQLRRLAGIYQARAASGPLDACIRVRR
jgi:monofunctional glycosyltransferase